MDWRSPEHERRCVLKILTKRSGNCLTSRIWLRGSDDLPANSRRDSYRLEFVVGGSYAAGEGLRDIGIPVMQIQRNSFKFDRTLAERLGQREDDDEFTVRVAESIAFIGLADLAGLELRSVGDEAESECAIGSELQAYREFLSLTGKSMDLLPADAGPPQRSHVEIPPKTAEIAIGIGIIAKRDGRIRRGPGLAVNSLESGSAIDAIGIMKSDCSDFGIPLPPGFESLDAEAAATALQAVSNPSAAAVNYYGNMLSSAHSDRLQAARTMPLLAEMYAEFVELSEAIDNRRKLNSAVAELTGLGAGKLKRISKLRSPPPENSLVEFGDSLRGLDALGVDRTRRFSLSGRMHLDDTLRLFREFDSSWVPDSDRSWRCFKDTAAACILPLSQLLDIPLLDFFRMSKGDWIKFHAGLASDAGIAARDFDRMRIALATNDAMEAVDDFCLSVFLPHVLATIAGTSHPIPRPLSHDILAAKQISLKVLVGKSRNPAGALLETARNWISRIPALMEADEQDRGNDGAPLASEAHESDWPALARDFTAKNNLLVRNLTTASALKEESQRLKHCVGRLYVRKCRKGASHVFSVQNGECRESYATFEVEPPTSRSDATARSELRIIQKKGFRNAVPGSASLAAIGEWLDSAKSGKLKLNLEQTIEWRLKCALDENAAASGSNERGAEELWNSVLSPNWSRKSVRAEVWQEWRRHILKGSLAQADNPGIIFRDPVARHFLKSLNPQAAAELEARRAGK